MQFHATLLQKNVAVSIGKVLAIDVKKTYGETTGPKERMTLWQRQERMTQGGFWMLYDLNARLCGDFNVLEIGKLPPRSYFIPFPTRGHAVSCSLPEKRYSSPLVKVLNGTWDFIYYDNPNDLPSSIQTDSSQPDALEFGTIDVPSCWQFRGYGKPAYINLRYPFRYAPPKVPVDKSVGWYFSVLDGIRHAPKGEWNHIGLYRTFFDVGDASKKYILSFLGVASCMELYINGSFVGYSEESHNTAEFDVSSLVHEGSNEMLVLVRRWCSGSYLECQDMFRNNGIFRDVLLRISNKSDIWDIDFKTYKHECLYDAKIDVEVSGSLEVSVSLEGHGLLLKKTLVCRDSCGRTLSFCFKDLDVLEWNAEQPNLYDLFIETKDSCVHQRVGFKDIGIKGRVFLVNGRPVKLKGVNHHDTSPTNGYAMTPLEIERDVKLCKQFNIDTIRTSHYAPDPLLLELAAEYGLYIVDEVDLETHGVYVQKLPPSMNWLSNDPKWSARYVDRAVRHYNRDKILSTPVVMWSLGNESGDGCNTYAMYEYFKSVSKLPVHYESAVHARRKAYDVASQMYPSVVEVSAAGEGRSRTKEFNDRPYFLCEYAHAMGVGPGNIEGYWKEIYSHEGLMGGCVWEMVDHSVLHVDSAGVSHYTYGGDHGEWIHDGNFCVDGIFYSDRKPSTGAWIVRHAYRPLRFSWLGGFPGSSEGLRFGVFNTTGFTSGNEFKVVVSVDFGPPFDLVVDAPPLGRSEICLDVPGDARFVKFDAYDKKGSLVGTDQIELSKPFLPSPEPVCSTSKEIPSFLEEPSTILFRAATDNDKPLFRPNPMKRWYSQSEDVFERKIVGDGLMVVMSNIMAAGNRFMCVDEYRRCKAKEGFDGAVFVKSLLHPVSARGRIPRFGKSFKLDSSFDAVRWFGREKESYVDMKEQSPIGEYSGRVCDMTEPNIRPQESGNRCDTQWVEIENDGLIVRFDAVNEPFNLGIKPYSDLELTKMKHREDEVRTGTYVTLSAFQQGIGTGSCGPYTLKEHMYSAKKDYELCFVVSWKAKRR